MKEAHGKHIAKGGTIEEGTELTTKLRRQITCDHLKGEKHEKITLKDLFTLTHLAGRLMNKKDPDDTDTRPCEEFMRLIKGKRADGVPYIEMDDMPPFLYKIFSEQPDQRRTDASEIIAGFKGDP